MNAAGRVTAWPNLIVELPATVGAPAPPVKGELGKGTHDVLARGNTPRGITQNDPTLHPCGVGR